MSKLEDTKKADEQDKKKRRGVVGHLPCYISFLEAMATCTAD